jgi:hypothetical protein
MGLSGKAACARSALGMKGIAAHAVSIARRVEVKAMSFVRFPIVEAKLAAPGQRRQALALLDHPAK